MNNFEVLTDAQHLRKRPNMYIGSTSSEDVYGLFFGKQQKLTVIPGLLKIISEIIDNSIDEAIRTNFKFANKISVSIKKIPDVFFGDYWQIVVEDNGRGIPVILHGTKYQPVIAWTQARAGSNFSDNRETIGANGVGSFATLVFSNEFIGETSDGKTYLKMVVIEDAEIKSVETKKSTKNFTKVSFVPDLAAFGIDGISQDHISFIHDRIENLSMCYPEIEFKFNDEKIKIKNIKDYASRFNDSAIVFTKDDASIIFASSGDSEEFRLHSYVNGLYISEGGSHIEFILGKIIDNLREHIRKKHKIEVLPNNIKQHLMLVSIFRKFVNCKFDSQTKSKITNTQGEVAEYLSGFDFDKISKQILNTPSIIDPMIAAILYKKEMAEKLALAKQTKASKKIRVVNHIAATSKIIDEKILLITEGLSAIGQAIECRKSPLYIGGYPLKGKILNVRGMKPTDIIKNKEIAELLSIIGLEFGKDPIDLNYGKIAIMTDSDVDGSHCRGLLLNLFSNWPKLFTDGRICQIETPLYICEKGKDIKWFYNKRDLDKANLKGYTINYCKGLGSLPKEVYKECINDPKFIVFENSDNFESLELGFGDSADDRKKWMMA